jgi:hypothetical protein
MNLIFHNELMKVVMDKKIITLKNDKGRILIRIIYKIL